MHITDLPTYRRKYVEEAMLYARSALAEGASNMVAGMREINMYRTAELYWVTKDMTRVAMDAAQDMPAWNLAVAPVQTGLIFFDGGLPELPDTWDEDATGAFGQKVAVQYDHPEFIIWHISGPNLLVHYGRTREGRLWSMGSVNFEGLGNRMLAPSAGNDFVSDIPYGRETAPALLWTLGATWTLMGQENVATARPQTVHDGPRKRRPPATVTTISLRRMRTVDTAPSEGGREYQHRWIVRGHWRQQRSGPGNSVVNTIWVPSYVKGPPGKPLLANEKVMVWRR